jgi:3-hydroxyisobutyrate dehydrogenase-like beta-hydroxyacid dehydrogenase
MAESRESKKTSVGIIGLGIIGSRVAAVLRRDGFPVTVWNRSPRPEPNFLSSPREIAEAADVIQLFVRDGEALLEIIRQMSPGLRESQIVMNHATVGPAETLEAAHLIAQRNAFFLDAPFTGSRDAAAAGELVYYVGGEESALELARPVLTASSKAILLMGPVGAATYIKIATNMISAAQVEVLAEALALLDRGGVPLVRLQEALTQNVAGSGVISAKLPLMLAGDFEPRFSVKNMFKDLQIALRTVEGKGIDLPVTSAAAGALMGALQAGWGEDDFASLARHYSYPGTQPGGKSGGIPEGSSADFGQQIPSDLADGIASNAPVTPAASEKKEKKGFFAFLRRTT